MPDFSEISEKDIAHISSATHLIESKIDGACFTWKNNQLLSERNCERSDRFPHIIAELKKLNWNVQGEVAVPFGNVLTLNSKEHWHEARYYVFDLLDFNSQSILGANPKEVRDRLEIIFAANKFDHLRMPFKWDDIRRAIVWTKRKKAEGLVCKPLDGTKGFKWKDQKEAKVPVIGYEPGKEKGAFLIASPSGGQSKVSGTSVGYVQKYQDMIARGEAVWVEIQYLFLTNDGNYFQPRLRLMGTKQEILSHPART